jgi:ClpP class serine protease
MPTLSEVQKEILAQKNAGQDTVRRRYLSQLARHTKRDTLSYMTAFSVIKSGLPTPALAVDVGDISGFMSALHGLKGDSLDLLLHSPGGSLEAADQIVQYLRAKYKHIRAIVPQNAMSAATMLACACDEIMAHEANCVTPHRMRRKPRETSFRLWAHYVRRGIVEGRSC